MCGALSGGWVCKCKRGGRPSKEGLAALLKLLTSLGVRSPVLRRTDGLPPAGYMFQNQDG